MKIMCGKTGVEEDFFDDEERDDERALFDATERDPNLPFYWSPALQDSFREELEKYVIIDHNMEDIYLHLIKACDFRCAGIPFSVSTN
jgi:phosphatidylinositol 4-kinase type 2